MSLVDYDLIGLVEADAYWARGHIGGSLTGDQMGRIIEAGEGCAADGATRLLLWWEGR